MRLISAFNIYRQEGPNRHNQAYSYHDRTSRHNPDPSSLDLHDPILGRKLGADQAERDP